MVPCPLALPGPPRRYHVGAGPGVKRQPQSAAVCRLAAAAAGTVTQAAHLGVELGRRHCQGGVLVKSVGGGQVGWRAVVEVIFVVHVCSRVVILVCLPLV
jgi:hypothetical protein